MTKNEIVNYVVETPHNVNKRILGQQLDELQKNVSWNDLKDKPFYTEVETYTIAENLPVTEEVYEGVRGAIIANEKLFSYGDKVFITAYGKQYETIAGVNNSGFLSAEVMEDDAPVVALSYSHIPGQEFTAIELFKGAGTVTITVVHETVHKLDAKYMPFGGGYDAVLVNTMDTNEVEVKSGSYAAIVEKMEQRVPVSILVMKVSEDGRTMSYVVVDEINLGDDNVEIAVGGYNDAIVLYADGSVDMFGIG